jgi:hypothetical protein
MPDAKTFIYRYDGDHASEEEETDFEGKDRHSSNGRHYVPEE